MTSSRLPEPCAASIPVPAPVMLPATRAHRRTRIVLPAIFVALLAFLLASSPVWNSGFWLHLAGGRGIVAGPDVSAISGPSAATPVQRTWLYDVVLYGGYALLGGVGLALCKAGLAAVLAYLLVVAGRADRGGWLAAAGATLALLAMGPWLVLGPAFLSYLLFALLLCLLRRIARSGSWKTSLGLFLLFAVWANTDAWFVLGLIVVACVAASCALGRRQPATLPAPFSAGHAGLLLLGCAAACLLNPAHVGVFIPGPEWTFATLARELRADRLLHNQFVSPWHDVYFSRHLFLSGPGLAFWLLVLASLASFWLAPWKIMRQRGIAWGVFFALSLLQTQVIPFFAMVAGTTVAMNAGEYVALWPARSNRRFLPAKAGLAMLALAALGAAWLGVFQNGLIGGPRAWAVAADPALVAMAEPLTQWHAAGKLHGRGFVFSPEAANQLAWFCPAEQDLLNSRLQLSPAQAADYIHIRNALRGSAERDLDWRAILRAQHIDHVVVYARDSAEAEKVVRNLIRQDHEWPLLYLGGGAAIFGWRDPARSAAASRSAGLEGTLRQLAFRQTVQPIPTAWPGRDPQPARWSDVFWKCRQLPSADLREASMALACYDALAPGQIARNRARWNACLSASRVAEGALPAGLPLEKVTATLRRDLFLADSDDGPPAALYLAIHAARRALHADPDDVNAWFTLAEAYNRFHTTRERHWHDSFPTLGRIRSVQAIVAYQNALRLAPDFIEPHERLAMLFASMDYKDLALEHLRTCMQLGRRRGPAPGEGWDSFARRMAAQEGALHKLSAEVEQLTNRFEINSANLMIRDRARLAGRLGLANRALAILLDADIAAFGTEGMDLELKLLLITGDAGKVREWMGREQEAMLPAYHWNKVQMYAADGDYDLADQDLEAQMRLRVLKPGPELSLRSAAGLIVGNAVLRPGRDSLFRELPHKALAATGALPVQAYRLFPDLDETRVGLWMVASGLDREGRTCVLRGLLDLEAGRIRAAENCFRKARAILRSPSSSAASRRQLESATACAIAERYLGMIGNNQAAK